MNRSEEEEEGNVQSFKLFEICFCFYSFVGCVVCCVRKILMGILLPSSYCM